MDRAPCVAVVGAGSCDRATYEMARDVGYGIGNNGWSLVCGGLGGVMEAAARGCMEAGGTTIAILPGFEANDANPYIRIAIPTGLGEARNALVVRAANVVVAISGGYGTLSEIALALKIGKPVVGMHTWANIDGVRYIESATDAIELVKNLLASS